MLPMQTVPVTAMNRAVDEDTLLDRAGHDDIQGDLERVREVLSARDDAAAARHISRLERLLPPLARVAAEGDDEEYVVTAP